MVLHFERFLAWLTSINLFLMMVLTFIDVLGRYIFAAPVPGAYEVTELMMGVLVFSALPLVTRHEEHVAIGLFDGLMNARIKQARDIVVSAVGCLIFGFLAWRIWLLAADTARYGDVTQQAGISLAPFRFFMAAMCLSCLITGLGLLIQQLGAKGRQLPNHR